MSAWERPGASDEWFTPKWVFDALGVTFDMDVAAPFNPRMTHVPAKVFMCADSLAVEWSGFVWMNPPYGKRNGLDPWLDKFFRHGNGIALVPDRTSAPWFQRHTHKADAIVFVSPKLKFERPDGSAGKQPGSGSALLASGERGMKALLRARDKLGILMWPEPRKITPAPTDSS